MSRANVYFVPSDKNVLSGDDQGLVDMSDEKLVKIDQFVSSPTLVLSTDRHTDFLLKPLFFGLRGPQYR